MMLTDPLASISDAFVTESDGTVTVDVTLNAPSTTPVTIDYSTSDGSATSPADFAAAFGSVTFVPGEIVQTIDVSIANDANIEASDESFYVDLTAAVGASITDDQALVTITDDDLAASSTASTLSGTGSSSGTGTGAWTFSTTFSSTGSSSGSLTGDHGESCPSGKRA